MREKDPSRSDHNAEVFGDKMYVFGGYDDDNYLQSELWSLDLSKRSDQSIALKYFLENFKWVKCEQKGDLPGKDQILWRSSLYCYQGDLSNHQSASIGNKMYIFGGYNIMLGTRTNRLFSLNIGKYLTFNISHNPNKIRFVGTR